MNDLGAFSTLFFAALAAILGWLVWNGLRTGSVWVRGARRVTSSDPRDWATPISKSEHPGGYWLALTFYAAALAFVLGSLVASG